MTDINQYLDIRLTKKIKDTLSLDEIDLLKKLKKKNINKKYQYNYYNNNEEFKYKHLFIYYVDKYINNEDFKELLERDITNKDKYCLILEYHTKQKIKKLKLT